MSMSKLNVGWDSWKGEKKTLSFIPRKNHSASHSVCRCWLIPDSRWVSRDLWPVRLKADHVSKCRVPRFVSAPVPVSPFALPLHPLTSSPFDFAFPINPSPIIPDKSLAGSFHPDFFPSSCSFTSPLCPCLSVSPAECTHPKHRPIHFLYFIYWLFTFSKSIKNIYLVFLFCSNLRIRNLHMVFLEGFK